MHQAAGGGRLNLTKMLLDHGALHPVYSSDNQSAKDLAKSRGHHRVYKYLAERETGVDRLVSERYSLVFETRVLIIRI